MLPDKSLNATYNSVRSGKRCNSLKYEGIEPVIAFLVRCNCCKLVIAANSEGMLPVNPQSIMRIAVILLLVRVHAKLLVPIPGPQVDDGFPL